MSDFLITSPSGTEMLGELPDYYEPILEMRVIVQAEGAKFDQLQADIEDQLNQRFVGTATWDLPNWEEELGIVPRAGQPIEQRRAVVQSKIRGYGKFSGRLLKNVAEAYDNGTVDVSFDPPTSTFTVRFVSTRGIPPNLNNIQEAIREIVPAYLVVSFEFTYLTWDELDSKAFTWDMFDAQGFTWDSLEVYRP
ncbi:putative phage tail protein [Paenibacillus naphthalenovorans]|uniref:putative phage tail protein n=1 Tax=Paenibacillus naphthalenovorans TaxID=162209 RepID=UPI00088B6CE2|nr:putative phage tail protein [Paenibacillus naphthalenovorans]SDJ92933.1 hypothetical protein SAMN05421868_1598 [Paenibacillus naphthalenovorans]